MGDGMLTGFPIPLTWTREQWTAEARRLGCELHWNEDGTYYVTLLPPRRRWNDRAIDAVRQWFAIRREEVLLLWEIVRGRAA